VADGCWSDTLDVFALSFRSAIITVRLYSKPMNELLQNSEVEGQIYTSSEQTLSAIPAVLPWSWEQGDCQASVEVTNK